MDEPGWHQACQLVRNLGRGRFGTLSLVRKCEHNFIRRTVHRLTTKDDLWNKHRISSLSHTNLEQIAAVFVSQSHIVIYSEHCSDVTMFDYIRGCFQPSIPEHQVLHWMCQILDGLQYLHRRGLQHGNLCAKNIILSGKSHLRLSNWSLSLFVSRETRTDLAAVGSIILVLITLNSALDGQHLSESTISALLEQGRHTFSEFLLNITNDLLSDGMESIEYLRGLVAAPDEDLCGSQPDMISILGDDHEQQVDSSPVHRKQRARVLHELAKEAARSSQGPMKHPSVIVTFFNLFKLSIKSWKRYLSPGSRRKNDSADSNNNVTTPRQLKRSASCPARISAMLSFSG